MLVYFEKIFFAYIEKREVFTWNLPIVELTELFNMLWRTGGGMHMCVPPKSVRFNIYAHACLILVMYDMRAIMYAL